jgi:hypothetical protein
MVVNLPRFWISVAVFNFSVWTHWIAFGAIECKFNEYVVNMILKGLHIFCQGTWERDRWGREDVEKDIYLKIMGF